MIVALGWKNIWRRKTRSMVVIIAVMLGIFGGTMATGIMNGWIEERIHSCIYNEVSHVQIHNPSYMYNEEMNYTVQGFDTVCSILDTVPEVLAYSPRVKIYAMAKTSWAASGFILKAVDPEMEMQVSEIHRHIVAGDFLGGVHKKPSMVIGSKVAEELKLLNFQVTDEKLATLDRELIPEDVVRKLKTVNAEKYRKEKQFRAALQEVLDRDEMKQYSALLVDHFSFYRLGSSIEISMQDKNGEIIHPVFKVRGIYKTSNTMFDGMNAFVDRVDLNSYTGLTGSEVHEIAILSQDNETGIRLSEKLEKYLSGQDVMSWRRLAPEIAMYTDFSAFLAYVYVAIILFALAFGIINTMMMSVLERIKELGMLMAIGMNRKKVFGMIMTESVFLTLSGALAGMIFSALLISLFSRTGISFEMWGEGFEAIGYAAVVYPSVPWSTYIGITFLVIITGMIASIWPARKALKLNPVEALRTE